MLADNLPINIESLHAKATDHGMIVFTTDNAPTAARDWQGAFDDFIAIAVSCGVRLLYLKTTVVDDELLEEWDERFEEIESVAADLLDELRGNRGEPISMSCSWRYDGIDHTSCVEASWWHAWEGVANELAEAEHERRSELRAKELDAMHDQLVEKLASDAEFRLAPRPQRVSVCVALFPELPRVAHQALTREASELMDIELQPKAVELRQRGMKPGAIALELGISESVAKRYIASAPTASTPLL